MMAAANFDQLFSAPTDDLLFDQVHHLTAAAVEAIGTSDSEGASAAVSAATSLLCKALARRRTKVTVASMRGLATVYGTPLAPPALKLEMAAGLSAAGGLAVRLEDWSFVRRLAILPSGASSESREQPFLIPHARLLAAQQGLLPSRPDVPLIDVANTWAVEHADSHPDLPAANGRVLDSICQFNGLATLIQFDVDQDFGFPEFKRFESRRTDVAFEAIVTDRTVRRELLGDADDSRIALLLMAVAAFGRQYFIQFGGWYEFGSRRVNEFLRAHATG